MPTPTLGKRYTVTQRGSKVGEGVLIKKTSPKGIMGVRKFTLVGPNGKKIEVTSHRATLTLKRRNTRRGRRSTRRNSRR